MKIYSTCYSSPIGTLLLQCNDEFLMSILYIDKEETHWNDVHEILKSTTVQLNEYFAGKRKNFDIPLEQSGTNFQSKVWELLYKIPYGKTVSYAELTKQYGEPKAIRAVASANGKNKLNIIVPCHRVVGSNGSLTGYSGGLWRKKWLLEHEAKFYAGVQKLNF